VKGTGFSPYIKINEINVDNIEDFKRAGGAEFVSPALQRGEKEFNTEGGRGFKPRVTSSHQNRL
jgi:hypothetical protein